MTDILALVKATEAAQTEYALAIDPAALGDEVERARFVLGEITATLEWLFDDGVDDERDAALRRLAGDHADDPDTHDALAAELAGYAALAAKHRDEMRDLGGFDAALIDEAPRLVDRLRERSAAGPTPGPIARRSCRSSATGSRRCWPARSRAFAKPLDSSSGTIRLSCARPRARTSGDGVQSNGAARRSPQPRRPARRPRRSSLAS